MISHFLVCCCCLVPNFDSCFLVSGCLPHCNFVRYSWTHTHKTNSCEEICEARQHVTCQRCRAECSTREATMYLVVVLVSVKACQGCLSRDLWKCGRSPYETSLRGRGGSRNGSRNSSRGQISNEECVCVCAISAVQTAALSSWLLLLFYPFSLFGPVFFLPPTAVVTQIRGHMTGSSPASRTTARAMLCVCWSNTLKRLTDVIGSIGCPPSMQHSNSFETFNISIISICQ